MLTHVPVYETEENVFAKNGNFKFQVSLHSVNKRESLGHTHFQFSFAMVP